MDEEIEDAERETLDDQESQGEAAAEHAAEELAGISDIREQIAGLREELGGMRSMFAAFVENGATIQEGAAPAAPAASDSVVIIEDDNAIPGIDDLDLSI